MVSKVHAKNNYRERYFYFCYYLIYTILFLFCFAVILAIFKENNASFVWELDGAPMLYPVFEYMGNVFRDFLYSFTHDVNINYRSYDFTLGLGKNIIQYAGNWYLEPLTLLSTFVRKEYAVYAYKIFTVARYYMCGIAFSVFCFYKKGSFFSTLLASMSYVFSFYSLFWGMRFPLFLVPMIYLPLLLVGIDKLLNKNKSIFFIGMIFISAWTHYYYLVINTAFLGIYFVGESIGRFKLYTSKREFVLDECRKCRKIVIAYFIGCSMAAVILLPNIYVFLHANRQSVGLNVPDLLHYDKAYYQKVWCYIAAPFEGFSIGYEAVLGLLPLSMLGVILQISDWKNKKLIIYLITGMFCLLFPIGSYILCGFSNVNNRWIYGFIFVSSYGLCRFFKDLTVLSQRQRVVIISYIFIYGISISTVCRSLQSECLLAYIAFFLSSSLLILLMPKIKKILAHIMIVLLLCAQIIVWEYYLYSPAYFNYAGQFMKENTVREKICEMAAGFAELEDRETFYRTDMIEAQRSNLAGSILGGYYGISDYSNVMCNDTYQYLLSVENAGLQENIMNYDLDGRTYLLAQNCVKYIACYESLESYLPYGFLPYKKYKNVTGDAVGIFCNEFTLPIGYTYDTYILQSDYDQCQTMERQEVFLNTLLIDDDIENIKKVSIEEIEKHTVTLNSTIVNMSNIERHGNVYTVLKGGGTIEIEYDGINNSEIFLRLTDLNITESGFVDWTWLVDNGSGNDKSLFLMSDYNYYRPDTHNYMINLGYALEPSGRCTIHIPQAGSFSLNGMEIFAQNFDNYEETIAERKASVLQHLRINGNAVAGDIFTEQYKILFMSIPYDQGWNAEIDGESAKIMKANKGYMAIVVPPGYHKIKMQYKIPALKVGMILSITGWMAYVFVFCVENFCKRKKR